MSTYCKKCEKCSTNHCPCRREGKFCNIKCGCSNCQNRPNADSSDNESDEQDTPPRASNLYKEQSVKSGELEAYSFKKTPVSKILNVKTDQEEDYSDIKALAIIITKKIRLSVAEKKDEVFEFRNNRDLYTNATKNDVENPQVDHIVEDQIVGHAAAKVFSNLNHKILPYLNTLKDALNLESFENYNVTLGEINQSKGSIIKSYLSDEFYRGYPIRAVITDKTILGRDKDTMERTLKVMNDTHNIVEQYVAQGRRSDGHVTGGPTFGKIADELARIFDEMDLDLETKRTRRKN